MVSVRRDVRITRDGGDTREADEEPTEFGEELGAGQRTGAAEADEEPTETEDEDEDDISPTSIADLVGEADPEVFDRTFLIEKEDLPASNGDPWPIPQPWQGLPRLAFVVNLNYVYDEENEEWVRQGPFEDRRLEQRSTLIGIGVGGGFSIPTSAGRAKIDFKESGIDTADGADPAADEITAQSAGIYRVTVRVDVLRLDAGDIVEVVVDAGGSFLMNDFDEADSDGEVTLHAQRLVELSEGDVVLARIGTLSNAIDPNIPGFDDRAYFALEKVAPPV